MSLLTPASLPAGHESFMTFFSGHDVTIFPLLVKLGVWDGVWPAYASNLAFEAWDEVSSSAEPETVIKIRYDGQLLCELSLAELTAHAHAARV